jgi:hypothetical protein
MRFYGIGIFAALTLLTTAGTAGADTRIRVDVGQECGGIAGIGCNNPKENFCLFEPGSCGKGDEEGVCTPRPKKNAPECQIVHIQGVCACNDVTFGNECEIHQAGLSVDHQGNCELPRPRP